MAQPGGWKQGKIVDMNVKANMDAWRQRLFKENGHTALQTRKQIEEKLHLIQGKNSYWHNFQKDDVVAKKTIMANENSMNAFGFNKVFEADDEEDDFRKDSKYQQLHKIRKAREESKTEQHSITTSSQQLGWRNHYDTFTYGNNRSGMCTRTFNDTGHL